MTQKKVWSRGSAIERSGASIGSLIVRAIEQAYSEPRKGRYVTGPLVTGSGKLGRAFPEDENPHDLVFSRTRSAEPS
jgi:hypothetical protein